MWLIRFFVVGFGRGDGSFAALYLNPVLIEKEHGCLVASVGAGADATLSMGDMAESVPDVAGPVGRGWSR